MHLMNRRHLLLGSTALILQPKLAYSTDLGDNTLLRLEFLVKKLKHLRKGTRNLLLALLLDAAIEIAERLYDWWKNSAPTREPVPPIDPALEAEDVAKKLNEIRVEAKEELERARLLIQELKGIIGELSIRPPPYRTCGSGMSRRSDGTCRDHTKG